MQATLPRRHCAESQCPSRGGPTGAHVLGRGGSGAVSGAGSLPFRDSYLLWKEMDGKWIYCKGDGYAHWGNLHIPLLFPILKITLSVNWDCTCSLPGCCWDKVLPSYLLWVQAHQFRAQKSFLLRDEWPTFHPNSPSPPLLPADKLYHTAGSYFKKPLNPLILSGGLLKTPGQLIFGISASSTWANSQSLVPNINSGVTIAFDSASTSWEIKLSAGQAWILSDTVF